MILRRDEWKSIDDLQTDVSSSSITAMFVCIPFLLQFIDVADLRIFRRIDRRFRLHIGQNEDMLRIWFNVYIGELVRKHCCATFINRCMCTYLENIRRCIHICMYVLVCSALLVEAMLRKNVPIDTCCLFWYLQKFYSWYYEYICSTDRPARILLNRDGRALKSIHQSSAQQFAVFRMVFMAEFWKVVYVIIWYVCVHLFLTRQ